MPTSLHEAHYPVRFLTRNNDMYRTCHLKHNPTTSTDYSTKMKPVKHSPTSPVTLGVKGTQLTRPLLTPTALLRTWCVHEKNVCLFFAMKSFAVMMSTGLKWLRLICISTILWKRWYTLQFHMSNNHWVLDDCSENTRDFRVSYYYIRLISTK